MILLKLIDVFKIAIEKGIKDDPRGNRVKEVLEENKKEYDESEKKEYMDESFTWNPYSDSNILFGEESIDIKTVMVGIDIESGEVLLAERLKEKGEKIDLLFAHHPEGKGLMELYKMVKIQEDILIEAGVNVSSAEKILDESYSKYSRSLTSLNYNRAVDTAKLLNIPFMNIHTPADNAVHMFLYKMFNEEKNLKLQDILDRLLEVEEYKIASKNQNGPKIISGSKESRAGNIYIDVTGGVEASDKVYSKMEMAGVGTIIGMHMSEAHLKKAKEHNINVIMAGHMSSDTLGMNLILDEIEKKESFVKIINSSGFTRVKRV